MTPALPMHRSDLPTPVLIIDRPALDRNIAAMAEFARVRGIALRPHAKTHKCAEIARRQLAAGATGIACAKLGEAEALAAAGIANLLITSPVVSKQAIARLIELNERIAGLTVVVDHPANVSRLAPAAQAKSLRVLIDIDPGFHRTGVTSAAAAVELAIKVSECPTMEYGGVQFYCGTDQHVTSLAERRERIEHRTAYLETVLAALASAGFEAPIVSGGGTGSFAIDAQLGVLTELQVGSYVFLDREYLDCEFDKSAPAFEPALAIDTRVVSANTAGQVTVDAGLKAMSTEAGPPRILAGADPATRYAFLGDEHGGLSTPPGVPDPGLDQVITLLPPHCDPTVNLYDRYAVCDGEAVVEFWPVTARGRSG
ncbi:MAG TPA: DSD1 family PLP-dependent enzyme [Novosphingobium sp.]|nr:DSD1 family PLP-dependent enzyme [Novosphingobium sp.]